MSTTERLEYAKVDLSSKNPFCLTLYGNNRNRNLSIDLPLDFGHGINEPALDLLRTVMLAHLVGKHLPKTIETNWETGYTKFLDELYRHYGYPPPRILKSGYQTKLNLNPITQNEIATPLEYANAHSGGLDSIYRLLTLIKRKEGVVCVHLHNLNPKGNSDEAKASQRQVSYLDVPYLVIRLRNGSDNTGFGTMRTRDMLLALMSGIYAKQKHAISKVMIEGGMQSDPTNHFSEYEPAWDSFMKLISESGLDIVVEWMDEGDIETVGEVLKLEKELEVDIIPLVQNCISSRFQRKTIRSKWKGVTPVLYHASPEQWCGSCAKCRRMTLGRIFYHDPRLDNLPCSEIRYFVENTYEWIKKYPHNLDLLTPSFYDHLEQLTLMYK